MTTYRVDERGATVFTEDGRAIATLRPGTVVVSGRVIDPGSAAGQYHEAIEAKRVRRYPNKRVRPAEDK